MSIKKLKYYSDIFRNYIENIIFNMSTEICYPNYEVNTFVNESDSYDDQSFEYDTIDDFDYDDQLDNDLYLDLDSSTKNVCIALDLEVNLPLELRQFTEKLHMERVLSDSLKMKHHFQPSREERALTTKDIACQNMLPILVKMGSWKSIVSLFNVNKTMYGYLDERNKDGLALKDEIKSQMFSYRQLDNKIMAKYYDVEENGYFTRNKRFVRAKNTLAERGNCSSYLVCAKCDESLSITTDTWIFIKEAYIVVSPQGVYSFRDSYLLQKNKDGVFEPGCWNILEAKNCLDKCERMRT
jgi:hypothetical protein